MLLTPEYHLYHGVTLPIVSYKWLKITIKSVNAKPWYRDSSVVTIIHSQRMYSILSFFFSETLIKYLLLTFLTMA